MAAQSPSTDLVPASPVAAESLTALAPIATPMTFQAVNQMAQMVVQSKLFPQIQTPQQALTLMMLAQADGLHPIDAVRRYDIIQGRPAMKAMTIQAEFQKAGGKIQFHKSDDSACEATFTAPDGSSLRVLWDMTKAAQAGLTSKPGPWKQFPGAMLRARCVSEGVRAVYPGVCLGIYASEEAMFFEPIAGQEAPPVAETKPAPERPVAERLKAATQDRPAPSSGLPEAVKAAMEKFGQAAETAGLVVRKPDAATRSPKMMQGWAADIIGDEDLVDPNHEAWRTPRPWNDANSRLASMLGGGWTVVEGQLMAPQKTEEQKRLEDMKAEFTDLDDDFDDPFAEDEKTGPKSKPAGERLL